MTAPFTAVACMKNEGAFLIDWVAHHKALGFDHLVICTNDCADPTVPMVQRLQALGLVRHHATRHWPATSIQRSALKQVRRYPEVEGAGWLWVCDADEYLAVRLGDGTVQALAAAASAGAEVVLVPWRIFGPAGQWAFRDAPVAHLFPLAEAPHPGATYPKALTRGLSQVHRIGIHRPVPREALGRDLIAELPGGVAPVPQRHRLFVQADWSGAQVNHYALRSGESFLVKRDRGRVNHTGQDMGLDYWDRFDRGAQACDLIRRYDDASAAWRARLTADADLAALHAQAVDWHRARAAHLAARPEWAPFAAALRQRLKTCASLPS
ncbi:MAG TPA: glycosyltransferase family 2 protein [Paracoccaceae bacterium]|nr:glycosyltransferase family 2 protein [Paracoccaceae bacterium]HMO71549.1 glycosyltransferase family 2 protein [Paracoccaceae bacterium]